MAITAVRVTDGRDTPSVSGDGKIREVWALTIPTTPASFVAGTGAGTTPTLTLSTGSTDQAGGLSVLTGSGSPATTAIIGTITFANTLSVAPFVTISPGSDTASALAIGAWPIVRPADTTTGVFVLRSGGTGLATTTTYIWNYVTNATSTVAITPKFITRVIAAYGPSIANVSVAASGVVTLTVVEDCANNAIQHVVIEGYAA